MSRIRHPASVGRLPYIMLFPHVFFLVILRGVPGSMAYDIDAVAVLMRWLL